MSTVDPFSTGSIQLHFRLMERLGTSVWKAEDTRSGKTVAVKILTRQLPKEQARRDALVRDIRLGAALYHAFLVPIQEVVVAGDALLMVMDWVDGPTLSKAIGGKPVERHRFFRIAFQIASALKLLHGKGYVHGNLSGDSILLAENDHVKIGGLNVSNVMTRRDATASAYQQRGNDLRSVSYMAPEQISGQQVDARTDLYSLGVLMYEMATGRLPHQAQTPAEMAQKIVSEPPASPKTLNPSIDNASLTIIGRCIFKDTFSRYKDVKLLIDDINKVDAEAAKHASALSSKIAVAPGAAGAAAVRKSLLFIAEIANYEELGARDPEAATRAAARMQQVLGEAVYLFDGNVVDPFGPRMIAEIPTVENALEAARKGEFDFSPEQQEGTEPIQVRLLLHAGDVTTQNGAVVGDAITKASAALAELPPLKLFVSEDFAKLARTAVRLRDAAARGGMKLFTIVPPEPPPPAAPPPAEEEPEVEAPPPPPPPRSRAVLLVPAIGAVAVIAVVAAMLLMKKEPPPAPPPAPKPVVTAPKPPNRILVQPFAIEGTDATLLERANAIRLATLEILRSVPELEIIDKPAENSVTLAATVRTGTAGPELVAEAAAAPVPLADAASGINVLVQWIAQKTQIAPRTTAVPEALNAFADAVAARNANDAAKTEAALRTAIRADPGFLPAQLMAMSFFESRENAADALAAAKAVFALRPDHVEAARRVARASLGAGDLRTAFSAFGAVLKKNPSDLEALNAIARYAISVGDMQRFNAATARLRAHPRTALVAHAPDHLATTGRIETAVNQYYDIEVEVPDNPALALKIGRIAVLRHTLPIAELELGKLQKSDPDYGYRLLRAYVAAQQRQRAEAAKELEAAKAAMRPGDDYWITAAEVYAMLADTEAAIGALEQAAARREAGAARVLGSSLFSYLESDPRFQKVKSDVAAQQEEIRAALAQVAL